MRLRKRVPVALIRATVIVVAAMALALATASTSWSDPDKGTGEKEILLPLNLTPAEARAGCKKVIPPPITPPQPDEATPVEECVGYYGDTRKQPENLEDGKVPITEARVSYWYDQLQSTCDVGAGWGDNLDCLKKHTYWKIKKPIQTNQWNWKCDDPKSLSDMADCFQEAVSRTLGSAMSFWMSDKFSPAIAPRSGEGDVAGVQWAQWTVNKTIWKLQQSTHTLAAIVAVIGIIIAAVRVAITHRAQPLTEILRMFFTIAAVTGLAAVTTQIALDWSDQFAPWVMNQASGTSGIGAFKSKWVGTFAILDQLAMLLTLGPLLIVAGLVQVMFMIVRAGGIVIMVAMLPLAASSTSFEAGKTWFKKICMWLLAFVLYKPAAAIIYGAGLMMINNAGSLDTDATSKQLLQLAAGTIVLFMAILCLPAMIKLFAPIAATGSSSAFSTAAVGGVALSGAVAAVGMMTGGAGLAAAGAAGGAAKTGGSNGQTDGATNPASNTGSGDSGPSGGGPGGDPSSSAGTASSDTAGSRSGETPGSEGNGSGDGGVAQRERLMPNTGAQQSVTTKVSSGSGNASPSSQSGSPGPAATTGKESTASAAPAEAPDPDADPGAAPPAAEADAAPVEPGGPAPTAGSTSPGPSSQPNIGAWLSQPADAGRQKGGQRSQGDGSAPEPTAPSGGAPQGASNQAGRQRNTSELVGAVRDAGRLVEQAITDGAGGEG